MKKFLLSVIAIFAMTICGFAQMSMPVCSEACAPHENASDYSTGVIPTYPTEFPVLHVGEPVDECVSIKIPSTINGGDIPSVGSIPGVGAFASMLTVTVEYITVNELLNLPNGLTACASANPMYANETYSLHITGTPTTSGQFSLNMRAEITGETSIPMVSIDAVNSYVVNSENGVSTNITIYVEGGEPAPVANFNTDPAATNVGIGEVISINQGESVTFTNTSTNAHHIAWEFEGGSPATSTENTVTVTYSETPESYYFTATLTAYNENESLSNTKTVNIVVIPGEDPNAVSASFTTDPAYTGNYGIYFLNITAGTTVTYTNTSTNADQIAWTFEGGSPATSAENTVAVTYATAGSYTTTLVAYGENETSNTATITVTVTEATDPGDAVEENAISEISVYPNPTSSVINIAAEGMQNITIMDMTGRVVMSKDVNSDFETINAEGFAKANYMVRIATADGVVVKNIVVE